MVIRFGYHRRALALQTLVCWIVLAASYFLSTREENINWLFGLGEQPRPANYLLALMTAMPALFYAPTHLVLLRWARKQDLLAK